MTEEPLQTKQPNAPDELTLKREEARVAMEGPERTAKRERDEQLKQMQTGQEELQKRLLGIRKEKERLELDWIELDNKRKAIRQVLNPLLDEEKKIETEEADLEAEEAKIGLPQDKRVVEEKRWQVQNHRKELEEKKWTEEDKLIKIEGAIAQNTARYRLLLDEEDQLQTKLDAFKAEEAAL